MGITEEIARFTVETKYRDLPDPVIKEAKRTLLEAIANAVLGSRTKIGKTMADVLGRNKEEPVAMFIGSGSKHSLETSAFYNTAITDCNDAVGGSWKGVVHPGKNVVPALLTIASAKGKSGKDLILAMMLGIECYVRIDLVMATYLASTGQYSDGVIGTLGSAIAISKLFGLDRENTRGAIGNAAIISPVSIGGPRYFNSASRPLTMGQSSSSALLSVVMQQAGVRGPSDLLEGDQGFVQKLSERTDYERITQDLGKVWECLFLYKKPFIGCRLTHATREAAQILKKKYSINPENIKAVTVRVAKPTIVVTGHYADIGSNIVGHSCSGPYLHANALLYDDIGPGVLTEERMNDPKLHELASRISILEDTKATALLSKGYEWAYRGDIEIVMKNGDKYSHNMERVKWDPFEGYVATDAELEEKLRIYTAGILSSKKADTIIEMVAELDKLDSTTKLMNLLVEDK